MCKPDETKTAPHASAPPKGDATSDMRPFAPFFDLGRGFSMPFGPEALAPWLRSHASKIEAISDELAAFEKAMIARLKANAADVAARVQDTLDYVQQVGAEWRKLAIDTARRPPTTPARRERGRAPRVAAQHRARADGCRRRGHPPHAPGAPRLAAPAPRARGDSLIQPPAQRPRSST